MSTRVYIQCPFCRSLGGYHLVNCMGLMLSPATREKMNVIVNTRGLSHPLFWIVEDDGRWHIEVDEPPAVQ